MNKTMHPIEPEELMAYLDGELPADRATAMASHLGECAECQSLVGELQVVSQSLGSWNVAPAQAQIPAAIKAALNDARPEQGRVAGARILTRKKVLSFRWETAEWIGALAAVAVIVVGTVRFIGGSANNVFSQVGEDASTRQGQNGQTAASAEQPKQYDRLEQFAKLNNSPHAAGGLLKQPASIVNTPPTAAGPMLIRTAQLSLVTKEFDKARSALEATLKRHRGHIGGMHVGASSGGGRTLTATLRVPADQLDATLAELKTLGRVESESQSGEDVTSQYVDLQARLANAGNTEQRLTDLLRNRTGKLSDVLEVEREVDRVRGEIERMEAERKNMANQVSLATLNATITEDYKAELQVVPPSTSTRLSNAAVEGYRSAVDGVLSLALFLLSDGPSLLLWGAVMFLLARFMWKRLRRRLTVHTTPV